MNGRSTVIFTSASYASKPNGQQQAYYAEIPGAHAAKVATVSLDIQGIDADTKVSLALEHSTDGAKWDALEDLVTDGAPLTATAYKVFTSTGNFGPHLRAVLKVKQGTPSTTVAALADGRASLKPF